MTCYIDPAQCLSWDALLPYVQPYVLGAPDEVILQAIRTSAIEFCRRSGILHDINTLDLQANVKDYPLETECDHEIVRVFEVTIDHRWRYSPGVYRRHWHWWCGPFQFYMESPNLIILNHYGNKDCPGGLKVEFVVQPKQDGCTLDHHLYEYWGEALAYGAIQRLLMMPGTTWFSLPTAKEFYRKYTAELARARTSIDLNFAMGPMKMRTERWV